MLGVTKDAFVALLQARYASAEHAYADAEHGYLNAGHARAARTDQACPALA